MTAVLVCLEHNSPTGVGVIQAGMRSEHPIDSRLLSCCRCRFAFHDYNRLAAEDERDVGDSTDIDGSDDWIVTDDDDGDDDVLGRLGQDGIATAEAPF